MKMSVDEKLICVFHMRMTKENVKRIMQMIEIQKQSGTDTCHTIQISQRKAKTH